MQEEGGGGDVAVGVGGVCGGGGVGEEGEVDGLGRLAFE